MKNSIAKRGAQALIATTAAVAFAGAAHATGTPVAGDGSADFDQFFNKISNWLKGSLGKTIGIVGLGVGAVQVLRNAYASAAGFVFVGLLLSLGPAVITSIFGAVI